MKAAQTTVVLVAMLLITALVNGQPADRTPSSRRPRINGAFIDGVGGRGVFSGVVSLEEFGTQNGRLTVTGTLIGAIADSTGTPLGMVNEPVVLPVTVKNATCELIRLDLGPAELDILGVRLQLAQDPLGITQRDGPQPQIGTALCSAAQSVIGHAQPAAIARLLNGVVSSIR